MQLPYSLVRDIAATNEMNWIGEKTMMEYETKSIKNIALAGHAGSEKQHCWKHCCIKVV